MSRPRPGPCAPHQTPGEPGGPNRGLRLATRPWSNAAQQAGQLASTLVATIALLRQEADAYCRTRLQAALLMVLAGSLLAAAGPLALRALVDALAPGATAAAAAGQALAYGAAYLLALCGMRVLADLRPWLTGAAEQRLHARLSRRFLAHLLALPMAFHVDRSSGGLVQTLAQAAVGCQLLIATLVGGIVPVVVEVTLVLVVLAHLGQPALVACLGATALACGLVSVHAALGLQRRAAQVAQANLQAHASLADSLANVEPIKCQGAEAAMAQRYAAATLDVEARWAALHRQRAGTGLMLTAVFTGSMVTSLLLALQAVERGALSLGGFVLVAVYLLQLVRPLETLSTAVRDLAQALAFVRPVLAVLERPPETPPETAPETPPAPRPAPPPPHSAHTTGPAKPGPMPESVPPAMALTLRNVHLAYPRQAPVLRGLDLDVAPGSILGIVGASGAGKTSLVRLLLRLYPAQAGSLLIDGTPIEALPLAELRAAIGLVPQDTLLLNASIADNIRLGRPGATLAEIQNAARLAQLHTVIQALPEGYATPVGERGLKLSGGERQRVAIARVALRRPRLLLLDEATSMLDAHTEAAVLQSLQQLGQGRTTLLIAHRLRALAHADEVVVLAGGRVCERGSPAALRAAGGPFARLWRAQMGPEAALGTPAAVPPRSARTH